AGAIGALGAAPELWYSIDGAPYASIAMTPTGNPDEWTAPLPAPNSAVVRYWLRAFDSFGGVASWPIGAPARRPFVFVRGAPSVVFGDDMEIDRGWTT